MPVPWVFPPAQRRLGILMLDTRFPRPLGDIGNPASWPVPTVLRVVPDLLPRVAVQTAAGLRAAGVLPAMLEAVRELEQAGCSAITTSCGFLVLLHRAGARSLPYAQESLIADATAYTFLSFVPWMSRLLSLLLV